MATHKTKQSRVWLAACVVTSEPQLEVHVNASLNVGLTPPQIVEALLHAAVYCGFPRALNATFTAQKVFAERGLLPIE